MMMKDVNGNEVFNIWVNLNFQVFISRVRMISVSWLVADGDNMLLTNIWLVAAVNFPPFVPDSQ